VAIALSSFSFSRETCRRLSVISFSISSAAAALSRDRYPERVLVRLVMLTVT